MKRFRTILAALTALMIGGCGGDSIQSPDFTQVLLDLTVSPQNQNVPQGRTQQYTALARYSLPPGSNPAFETREIENVTWSSSDTTRVTIDSVTGLATVLPNAPIGQVTIRATAEDAEGTATLNVVGAVVDSLVITLQGQTTAAPDQTIPVDGMISFEARATLSNGQSSLTPVTWSATNSPNVLSVTPGPANQTTATAFAQGVSVITAVSQADPSLTDTVQVNVRPFIVDLTVSPDPGSTPLGRPIPFVATGTLKRSQTLTQANQPILSGLSWSVVNNPLSQGGSTATVAVIDPDTGVAVGQRVGTATVTAVATSTIEGGASDSAALIITPAVLERLEISPDSVVVPLGGISDDVTANGVFSDGRIEPIAANWTLEPANPALISFTLNPAEVTRVNGLALGSGTIRATAVSDNALTDTAAVSVVEATLLSLKEVRPLVATRAVGRDLQFELIGNFSGGAEFSVPEADVSWASSDLSVASIDADGLALALVEGQTTITATYTGSASITGGSTRTRLFTVTNEVCTQPLLAADGAQVTDETEGLCLGCAVLNPERIIDASPVSFGTLFAPIQTGNPAVVAARVTAGANGNYTLPFPAGQTAGFVIGRPAGLLSAQVLDRLQVSTLLNGVIQETKTGPAELRVDLLGQELLELGSTSDVALVSLESSLPYDAIQISARGEVLQVLDDVQVFRACGEVTLPVPLNLAGVSRIEPIAPTLVKGQGLGFRVFGNTTTGAEVEIADADLIWTTSNDQIATVDANGFVAAIETGTATITATLRDYVTTTGGQRSAVSNVTVVESACTQSFSSFPNVTVTSSRSGLLCPVLCSATNLPAAADGSLLTAASANIPLSLLDVLLGESISLSVRLPVSADDLPGGAFTGFILGRPIDPVLQAELLDSVQVSTLRRNALGFETVVETRTTQSQIPLRLDLLGLDVLGENELVVAGLPTTLPYDGIRVTFNAGVLSLLSDFKVFESCATAVPAAP